MRLHTMIDRQAVCLSAAEGFDQTVDIAVAGMGTAGAMAVIQAAREGFSVLGIDRENAMGGQGGVGGVWDYYYGCPGGLQDEVAAACAARMAGGLYVSSQRDGLAEQSFPGPVKAAVLEEMALAAGASLLYGAVITGVYREGDRAIGLRVLRRGKALRVGARVIIDATGEAEAAYLAGCRLLPPRLADGTHQYVSKARSVMLDGKHALGTWSVLGRVNLGDASALSQAVLSALGDPFEMGGMDAHHRTVYEAPMLGAREGRRVDSTENLTLADVLAGRETCEPILYASSHVDSFNHDLALEDECLQDYQGICGLRQAIISVGVPMGALIPCDVDGLLVAGRCLGVDHNIAACVRMKRDMEKTGEAAAVLAAQSLRLGVEARDVPYSAVRAVLEASGCLSEAHRHPWLRCTRWTNPAIDRSPYKWPTDETEMRNLLASDCPDTGLWVCRQDPARWEAALLRWLEVTDGLLPRRAALALGMAGHPAALPLLRRMASEPGEDRWKALCLLTRYAQSEDAALYLTTLRQPLTGDVSVYEFLQAEMGLLRLIEQGGAEAIQWTAALAAALWAKDFSLPLALGRMDLADTARRIASPNLL